MTTEETNEDTSGHAAELYPAVELSGEERYHLLRILNNNPKKGGVDGHDYFEDIIEALEKGDSDEWCWRSFRKKGGMALDDPRNDIMYPIRMKRKEWGRLREDIKGVIELGTQQPEPYVVTRMLARVYRAIQKVL